MHTDAQHSSRVAEAESLQSPNAEMHVTDDELTTTGGRQFIICSVHFVHSLLTDLLHCWRQHRQKHQTQKHDK